MGILQYPQVLPGQVGVVGAMKYMVTTDSLATITAAGYLNNIDLGVFPIRPTDTISVIYSASSVSGIGTYAIFTVSITNGVITLVLWANPGDVLLPVVNGDLAVFNGTTGQIKDSGIVAANIQQFTQTFTLNQAAVQGAYATPVALLPAPGAGLAYFVTEAAIYTNFKTSAFTGGGVAIVQYDNTVNGAGTDALAATIPAAEITASASQLYYLNGNTANALTGITNKGIFFSNQTGAFTGGNAASTVVITLNYLILTATV